MACLDIGNYFVIYVPKALFEIVLNLLLPMNFVHLFTWWLAPLLEQRVREVFEEELK